MRNVGLSSLEETVAQDKVGDFFFFSRSCGWYKQKNWVLAQVVAFHSLAYGKAWPYSRLSVWNR
jgi:hypothetical protein